MIQISSSLFKTVGLGWKHILPSGGPMIFLIGRPLRSGERVFSPRVDTLSVYLTRFFLKNNFLRSRACCVAENLGPPSPSFRKRMCQASISFFSSMKPSPSGFSLPPKRDCKTPAVMALTPLKHYSIFIAS
ncbi:hypothetical protein YC2023_020885 [Brassica napus]